MLSFETLNSTDYLLIHPYSTRPEFYEFLEYDPFVNLSDTEAYVNRLIQRTKNLDSENRQVNFYWLVRHTPTDTVLGTCCIVNINWYRSSGEIGLVLILFTGARLYL